MGKPLLCLNFDGTVTTYASGWQGVTTILDLPVNGLFDFLLQASRFFEIHIFSSRSHQEGGREAMINWFIEHGPELAASYTDTSIVWYAAETGEPLLELTFPSEKPPAFVTLDDRSMTFTGIWPDPQALLAFKPWHKA